jgi:hypothetical protein
MLDFHDHSKEKVYRQYKKRMAGMEGDFREKIRKQSVMIVDDDP